MKKIFILLTLLCSGCVSISLMPPEQRKLEIIEQSGVSAKVAYSRALAWMAKSYVDFQSAFQLRDEMSLRIISPMHVMCPSNFKIGSIFDTNEYKVRLSMDFQAKENRVRFLVEDIQVFTTMRGDYPSGPQNAGELDRLRSVCLQPVLDAFLDDITGKTSHPDW